MTTPPAPDPGTCQGNGACQSDSGTVYTSCPSCINVGDLCMADECCDHPNIIETVASYATESTRYYSRDGEESPTPATTTQISFYPNAFFTFTKFSTSLCAYWGSTTYTFNIWLYPEYPNDSCSLYYMDSNAIYWNSGALYLKRNLVASCRFYYELMYQTTAQSGPVTVQTAWTTFTVCRTPAVTYPDCSDPLNPLGVYVPLRPDTMTINFDSATYGLYCDFLEQTSFVGTCYDTDSTFSTAYSLSSIPTEDGKITLTTGDFNSHLKATDYFFTVEATESVLSTSSTCYIKINFVCDEDSTVLGYDEILAPNPGPHTITVELVDPLTFSELLLNFPGLSSATSSLKTVIVDANGDDHCPIDTDSFFLRYHEPGYDPVDYPLTYDSQSDQLSLNAFEIKAQNQLGVETLKNFELKFSALGGSTFTSPQFIFDFVCGPDSTTISAPEIPSQVLNGVTQEFIILQKQDNLILYTDRFSSSNPNCSPSLSLDSSLSSIPTLPQKYQNFTIGHQGIYSTPHEVGTESQTLQYTEHNTTHNKVVFPATSELTDEHYVFYFNLRGSYFSHTSSSEQVSVIVMGPCSVQPPIIIQSEIQSYLFRNTPGQNGFQSGDNFEEFSHLCQIQEYDIEKVEDKQTGSEISNWDDFLSIDKSTGIVSATKFEFLESEQLGVLKIYLSASNGQRSSTSLGFYFEAQIDQVIIPTVTQQFVVNIPPSFVDYTDGVYEVEMVEEQEEYEVSLPQIFDETIESVQVQVESIYPSLTYSSSSHSLTFNNIDIPINISATIILTDEVQSSTSYSFLFKFITPPSISQASNDTQLSQNTSSTSSLDNQSPQDSLSSPQAQLTSSNKVFKGIDTSKFSQSDIDFFIYSPEPDHKDSVVDEVEERKPIEFQLIEMNTNGKLSVQFSEQMLTLDQLSIPGFNISTLNILKDNFLELSFTSKAYLMGDQKPQESKIPKLTNWTITEFVESGFTLNLNFSNPLYVSTYNSKDEVSLKVVNPSLFQASRDLEKVAVNYTLQGITLPQQFTSLKEFESVQSVAAATEQSMLFSLLIPFAFMMLMSVSIDRVWGLYNLLQVVSNFVKLNSVLLPPSSSTLLQVLFNVSNFNVMQNPFVQYWISTHVLSRAKALQDFLFKQDPMVLMLSACTFLIIGVVILSKVLKKKERVQKLKDKLMWNSVLRSQLQTYLPASILTFTTLQTLSMENLSSSISPLVKLVILVFLPIFSYWYLKRNQRVASEQRFKVRFETLYLNTSTERPGVYLHSTVFCLKRLLVATATVFANEQAFVQVFVYSGISVFSFGYVSSVRPMNLRSQNQTELLQEVFVLLSSYWLIIFTDFVESIETRRSFGYLHLYSTGAFIAFSLVAIVRDLLKQILAQRRRKKIAKFRKIRAEKLIELSSQQVPKSRSKKAKPSDDKPQQVLVEAKTKKGRKLRVKPINNDETLKVDFSKADLSFKEHENSSEESHKLSPVAELDPKSPELFTFGEINHKKSKIIQENRLKVIAEQLKIRNSMPIRDPSTTQIKALKRPEMKYPPVIHSHDMDLSRVTDRKQLCQLADDLVDAAKKRLEKLQKEQLESSPYSFSTYNYLVKQTVEYRDRNLEHIIRHAENLVDDKGKGKGGKNSKL